MCMHNLCMSVSQSMLLTYYESIHSSDIGHSKDWILAKIASFLASINILF